MLKVIQQKLLVLHGLCIIELVCIAFWKLQIGQANPHLWGSTWGDVDSAAVLKTQSVYKIVVTVEINRCI